MTMSDKLPSNVSIISTEIVVTRKTIAGVQIESRPSSDATPTDDVAALWSSSLTFSVRIIDHTVIEPQISEQNHIKTNVRQYVFYVFSALKDVFLTFPVRRYASAILAVIACPSVRLFVRHKPVL